MASRQQETVQGIADVAGLSASFSAKGLIELVAQETNRVQNKVNSLQSAGDSISITDMFEMQLAMNKLSQCSEMSTSVVSSANQAIISVTRNVKG